MRRVTSVGAQCPVTSESKEVVMLAAVNNGGNANTMQEPGMPMRLMAGMLAERGFDVRGPEYEESRLLTITNVKRARCEISVHDDEGVVWEYFPLAGGDTESAEISSIVLRILGADENPCRELDTRMHLTLKGAVAREMRARGLKADLNVYENEEQYDVVAEVVLSNPAKPERGLVRLTDDGVILWECDHGGIAERAAVIVGTTADVLVPCRQVSKSR